MDLMAIRKLTYGLHLLTAREDGKDNGCVINTTCQVADDPVRISISVLKGNLTHDMVKRTGIFNISNISTAAEFALFQRFGMQSGRDVDKFEGLDCLARSENGLYYLTRQVNMTLSAKVVEALDLGTHTLFIAEVTDALILNEDPSCSYAYYQSEIKPKPAAKKGWVCTVCGYVYEGDELPEDYVCPLCLHGVQDFVPAESAASAGKNAPTSSVGKRWVCSICGYVHEGDTPPEECPLCKVGAEEFKEEIVLRSYACACGYVYDPALGDPEGGIAPGTPWEELPDDWRCPICTMGKGAFTQE